jgi:hypothetical protein
MSKKAVTSKLKNIINTSVRRQLNMSSKKLIPLAD